MQQRLTQLVKHLTTRHTEGFEPLRSQEAAPREEKNSHETTTNLETTTFSANSRSMHEIFHSNEAELRHLNFQYLSLI